MVITSKPHNITFFCRYLGFAKVRKKLLFFQIDFQNDNKEIQNKNVILFLTVFSEPDSSEIN